MKIFYDIPYMKDIMQYVLVPIVVVLIVVGVALFIYSKKVKDHDSPRYNFVMNFWSSLIGIVVTGAILAIAVGFSIAMTEKMHEYHLVEEKKMLYYLLKYFIVIPFVFVVWYVVKFLKTIYYKPKREKNVSALSNASHEVQNSIPVEEAKEQAIEVKEEAAKTTEEQINSPIHQELPPIEETLKEEMKQFDAKTEQAPTSSLPSDEEVEVISLEDE